MKQIHRKEIVKNHDTRWLNEQRRNHTPEKWANILINNARTGKRAKILPAVRIRP